MHASKAIMDERRKFLTLLTLVIVSSQLHRPCGGAWWFSSSKPAADTPDPPPSAVSHVGAEFALDSLDGDESAIKLVENAKLQMRASSLSCWLNAYSNVFGGCRKISSDQDLKDRLSWDLSDCFQKHSGRPPFPHCDRNFPTKNCLKRLDDDAHKVFLQFFLQIDSICHQLQVHAFKHQTERLVNELKKSAEYAEDKLNSIEEKGEILLQNSKHIHGALSSIDEKTQQVAETSRNLEESVNSVKIYSEEIHERSKGIASAQEELIRGQSKMRERMDEGMEIVRDSYSNLGAEISSLKEEAAEIERGIEQVGEAMYSRMDSLRMKADDIQNLTGNSLDNQKKLLEVQTASLEGLRLLASFQSQALQESRGTLQELSEFGKRQQQELLQRQQELQRAHNQLAHNSKSILAAQEEFESKQAGMLNALEKLFALHNAMLVESRSIKALIVYSLLMFVLYMLTSTKQTYSVRPGLYLGLFVAFAIELCVVRFSTCSFQHQTWTLTSTRWAFLTLALIQIVYSFFTYRDYEVMNHDMLLRLMEKINGIERRKELDEEEESDVDWSWWIDADLPEDVGLLEDPNYQYAKQEQVGENSVESSSVFRKYNLRSRRT